MAADEGGAHSWPRQRQRRGGHDQDPASPCLHLCEAICGLNIEVSHDHDGPARISAIKGDPDDPFSRGHICPKAVALQDIQNDPDRLRQPHRRVGEQWQAIGWDAAFALAAERLWAIQQAHGRNSVAVYQGNPSVHNYG